MMLQSLVAMEDTIYAAAAAGGVADASWITQALSMLGPLQEITLPRQGGRSGGSVSTAHVQLGG